VEEAAEEAAGALEASAAAASAAAGQEGIGKKQLLASSFQLLASSVVSEKSWHK